MANNKPEVAVWYDALTCEVFFNPDVFPIDSLEEIPLYLEPPEDNSNNKTAFNPTIEFHGPAAIHNMVCPILHHTQELAVYDCNGGYFKPSLKAQEMGYHTVYANNWLKRLIIKYIFK